MLSLKGILGWWDGRDLRRRPVARAAATVCEQLENRRLLTVYTYNAPRETTETMTLMYSGGYYKIFANGEYPLLFPEATGLVINGNGRNNVITIDKSVSIPVTVKGGAGNDRIVANGSGDCLLMGEGGKDTLVPGNGNDTLIGGAGVDVADFSGRSENLDITLDELPNDIVGDRTANLFNDDIETWIGGAGNDLIDASKMTTAVAMKGGNGNDTLLSGSGNDVLDGGGGLNVLDGGQGEDTIVNWGTGKWTVNAKNVVGKAAKAWPMAMVYVDGGILTVTGTAMDDKLSVTSVGLDWYVANVNGTKWAFPREGIKRIAIYGGPGNDKITFAEAGDPISARMVAQGGAGKNTITVPVVKDTNEPDIPSDPGGTPDSGGPGGGDGGAGEQEPGNDPEPIDSGSEQPTGSGDDPQTDAGNEPQPGDGTEGQDGSDGDDATPVIPAQKMFAVYEDTYFVNKPDLSGYGIEKPIVTGNSFFWRADNPAGGYDLTVPNEAATRNIARMASDAGKLLVIDIERWPVDIRTSSPAEVQVTMQKLGQIADWVHSERPDVKLGFYGVGPLRDYWTPVQYWGAMENSEDRWYRQHLPLFESLYLKWQAANDFLKPLMDKADCVIPSLYTFYENQTDWVRYAKGNLEQAKRYGKPVIPFIWMSYHNSTGLIGQDLSAEYWQLQLNTVRELADGVVIWGGMKYSRDSQPVAQTWDEQASWWTVTKSFIEGLGRNQ
ncbi:MAG TPA: hypothetical protein VHP11_12055 [Tepidisphaeraceae bacterium]|nr:hypothetical protein [Tepidisphaeraceae bacterium]